MNYLGQPIYSLTGAGGGGGGTGDVIGPGSSTANAVPRFTDASGKELKNSVVVVSDTGAITGATSIETDAISAPSGTLNITAPTSFSLTTSAPTGINMNVSSVVVKGSDFARIQSPNAYVEGRGADVNIGSAGDVVIDTDGTVSLFGRASPTAVAITGNTVLSGDLAVTGDLTTAGDVTCNTGTFRINGSVVQIQPSGTCQIQPTGILTLKAFTCGGAITMNGTNKITGLGAPTAPNDAATKSYVDSQAGKTFGQLLYNDATNIPLTTSGQLSTVTYNRLLPPITTVTAPYYVNASAGVNVIDNTAFELTNPGTYRARYRVGLKSNAASQFMYLILRINNVLIAASIQVFLVDNVNIVYKDFEYIFTTTAPNERAYLFAKVETTAAAIQTSYLCFNITSV